MPTIFTPPQLEPHRPTDRPGDRSRDPGEGDHGSGRRPPTDKRTGGSGDGDNWHDRPVGARGPRERLTQARVGLGLSLSVVFLFFVGIVTAFLVTKSNYHFDAHYNYVNSWLAINVPTILFLNTAILLLSSVTAEYARRSMFREQDIMEEWIGLGKPISRRATVWLSLTLALGVMFVAGQTVAWSQLRAQPAFLRSLSSTHFFYIFTGVHALHLLIGLVALVAALAQLRASRQFATRQIWVDIACWYWHAMGALWVLLFLVLEFCQ